MYSIIRPLAHVVLGPDHVVDADLVQDPRVRLADRLGPHVADAELEDHRRRQDARLEVGAHAHDGAVELRHAQLAHGLEVGGVGLHDVGQPAGERADDPRVGVDAEDLDALLGELERQRAAEAAESDHDDARGVVPSQ
jgi:hypothetical protein